MKTKFVKAALLVLSCLAVLASCTKEAANPVSRSFNIAGFDKVAAGDDHEVIITAGNDFSVLARGDARDVNELGLSVSSRSLQIGYPVYRNGRKRVHIYISMPKIVLLDFGGASYGNVSGFAASDTMKVSLSGDASFTVNANIALFDVNVSGSSELTINGSANKLVADVSGQGRYFGYGLGNTGTALIWTSGQANAFVYSNNQLLAEASGQSKIFYKGNPAQKTLNVTGEATIIQQ